MIRTIRTMVAAILTTIILLSMPLTAFAEMLDIQGHWAEDMITRTVKKGIMMGYPDGTFRPDNPMTQAEFITLINRSFGFHKTAELKLPNIGTNDWYAADFSKAKAQGYLELLEDGMVMPKEPISRQMVSAILGKVLKLKPDESIANRFSDAGSFTAWAKGLSGAVSGNGYMNGYKDNTFRPDKNISRAEVSTIIFRAVGELYDKAGIYGDEKSITTIEGNVTVSNPDITLKNMVIEGNLYLTEGIGEGAVTLDRVTVTGTVTISGGGGGIFLKDTSLGKVVICTFDSSRVYLAAQGNSLVGAVKAQSGARLEELDLTGVGFGEVEISPSDSAKVELAGDFDRVGINGDLSKVSILRGTTKLLESNGKDTLIEIDKSVRIETLTVNKPARMTGSCYVGIANINSNNVYIEARPMKVNIAVGLTGVTCTAAVTASSSGGKSSGGGGSSGGGSISATVYSVDSINTITVDNGTAIGSAGLPTTIGISINNGTAGTAGITWDTTGYDANKAGTYTLYGTLINLPAGVANSGNLKASVKVIVGNVFIASIAEPTDVSVDNGTVIENISLPTTVTATLSNGTSVAIDVTWDKSNYNGNTAGTYIFPGTLTLPIGVVNSNNVPISMKIIVGNAVITSIAAPSDVSVDNGTVIENISLPTTVTATLSNGTSVAIDVTWDKSSYNGNVAATYTFPGTLTLPTDVVNSNNVTVSVKVIVGNAIIASIAEPTEISVANGTLIGAVVLPGTVTATLSNGTTTNIDVTWDKSSYNGNVAATYTFSGTLTLPTGVVNSNNVPVSMKIIVGNSIIASIAEPSDVSVDNGTVIENISLPTTVTATLSNGTSVAIDVTWDKSGYNGNVAATYTFSGTLTLPTGVVNSNNVPVSMKVIVGNAIIGSIAEPTEISVANGTTIETINLPTTVTATLSNGTSVAIDVIWDKSSYNGNVAATYTFPGTLTLPTGVVNSNNVPVSMKIIVGNAIIASIAEPTDFSVDNGTVIENISLPTTVTATLSNGTSVAIDVTWDKSGYNGNVAATYTFSGTLTLPTGVVNSNNVTVSMKVIVGNAIITSIAEPSDVSVDNGTAIENISLPTTVTATLSNGTTTNIDVAWDKSSYNGNVSATYTFSGTLINLPAGVANSGNLKASVKVTVGSVFIASIAEPTDFSVDNGTVIENISLPTTVTATLSNGTSVAIDVTWDKSSYNGNVSATYTFSGTLINLPAGVANSGNLKASVKVTVGSVFIASIAEPTDFSVDNGTVIENISLPTTVTATLSNGTSVAIDVTWDKSSYNGNTAGTYIFPGTLTLPIGVVNSNNVPISMKIIVGNAVITSIAAPSDVSVDNGTVIENISLPTTVTATLSNGTTTNIDVAWDKSSYNGNVSATYTFSGTLINLPAGVANSGNLKASVKVTVGSVFIASIAEPTDVSVDNGTVIENISLPTTVTATLSNGTSVAIDVTWDATGYDANTAGRYTLYGTLTNLSAGVVNSGNLKASVKVIVGNATVASIVEIADINVTNGTAAGSIGLPMTVKVILNNGTTPDYSVTWDGGTPTYDGNTEGTYTFSGTLTIPTGVATTDLKASVNVIVGVSVPTGTYTISSINIMTQGMSVTISNLSDANYFNVYRISNDQLVNPDNEPVLISTTLNTFVGVYNDPANLEIWVYSDSAGSDRKAVFTLSGNTTSGTLDLKQAGQ